MYKKVRQIRVSYKQSDKTDMCLITINWVDGWIDPTDRKQICALFFKRSQLIYWANQGKIEETRKEARTIGRILELSMWHRKKKAFWKIPEDQGKKVTNAYIYMSYVSSVRHKRKKKRYIGEWQDNELKTYIYKRRLGCLIHLEEKNNSLSFILWCY